jgi:sugar phosphate isomerase/epimerase
MKKQAQLFLLFAFTVVFFTKCSDQSSQQTTDLKTDSTDVTKNWKIGVQMWTFNQFPFVTALDKVDSAGAKYIEAFPGQQLGGGMKGGFGIDMSADDKAKLKQILQSKGISIVAMGVIVPKDVAEWKKYFDLAKEFGLSYITAEPLKDQWGSVDSLAGIYGIKVAIHDHPKPNVYWSPDSVLAATVGHPNIGSCADVGHWARNGLNPVDCMKKLEGHIFGVHLKDIKVFGQVDAADTAVGYGVNNFPAIFAELKRQNFNGMLSVEQESNWLNSVPDVKHTIQYYKDEVAKLK